MQKAILPFSSLPPISASGKYYIRYRVVSEDKSAISDWSMVHSISGKLVKDILGYEDTGVALSLVATEDGMSISWDLPEQLQNSSYDVFVKWSYDEGDTYDEQWALLSTVRVNTAYIATPQDATHMKARIQIETWDKKTTINDVEIVFDSSTTSQNYVLVAESEFGVSTGAIVSGGTVVP